MAASDPVGTPERSPNSRFIVGFDEEKLGKGDAALRIIGLAVLDSVGTTEGSPNSRFIVGFNEEKIDKGVATLGITGLAVLSLDSAPEGSPNSRGNVDSWPKLCDDWPRPSGGSVLKLKEVDVVPLAWKRSLLELPGVFDIVPTG